MAADDPAAQRHTQRGDGADRAHPPLAPWLLRLPFTIIGPVAPSLMARWANRLWRTTRRYPRPTSEQRLLQKARRETLDTVAVNVWGEGPTVLLVHGWNGRGTQMGGFVGPLLRAGYRVVAPDLPGHGDSPGRQCSVLLAAAALQTVGRRYGPFAAAISHSFGGACLLLAMSDGLAVGRAVCISPPNRLEWLAARFADALQLPAGVRSAMLAQLEARYGDGLWDRVAPEMLAASLGIPGLIVHDRDDRQLPWRQAEAIARAWPGAELMLTDGLGHSRILYQREVIRRVVAFVRA